jgi:hypothetical protein
MISEISSTLKVLKAYNVITVVLDAFFIVITISTVQ